jgi:hypothetical protein
VEDESIESLVEKAETLTALYGAWPNFHDAEVIELHLWRGYMYPGDWDERNIFPVLTAKILILDATQPGATGSEKDVLVTLRFHGVDALRLQDFNHNNSIVSLRVSKQPRGHFSTGEPLPPSLLVTVEQGFGLAASFSCSRIEVVNAESAPPGPLGQPHP